MLIKQETIDGFFISFYALPPDDDINESFEPEDAEEFISKIQSGEYVHFIAKITASKNGIKLADSYLGSCVYSSYNEFWNLKEDYCADMIHEVIIEAREKIAELIKDR